MPRVATTDTYLGSVPKRPTESSEQSCRSDETSEESGSSHDDGDAHLIDMHQAILQGLVGVFAEGEEWDEANMEVPSDESLDWLRSEIARGLG